MKTLALTLAAVLSTLSLVDLAQAADITPAEAARRREFAANRQAANNQAMAGRNMSSFSAQGSRTASAHGNRTTGHLTSRQRELLRQQEARRRASFRRGYNARRLGVYGGPTYILPPQNYVFVPGVGLVPVNVNYGFGYGWGY